MDSDKLIVIDPDIQAKIELLRSKLDQAINHVQGNRKVNRTRSTRIKLAIVLSSGLATILLGLQLPEYASHLKNIAFIFTAVVTVLGALEPFFNYRALWVEHEIALWKFYRLKDRFDLLLAGNNAEISLETLEVFRHEYEGIWNDLSQSWINYRKQDKS